MKKKGKRKEMGKIGIQVEKQVYRQKNMCIGRKICVQEEKQLYRKKNSYIGRKIW